MSLPRAVSWFLLALPLFGGSPVFNGTFEKTTWSVVRGIGFPDPAIQHDHHKALVVQPLKTSDAYVVSPSIKLNIGRRYVVGGYIRTEQLQVSDNGRSPIATGAALSMASMPWDVHSESLGGTTDWTRIQFRFIATRAEDNIVLKVADGGAFQGKAWFEGISIDEISTEDAWPVKAAVKTYGPAYRYPQGGWIYLHIQGQPYERGYQHGFLMSREIPQYLERCAYDYDPESKDWTEARNTANALFLRGFDQEILEEMKGIADGASDAGAKWQGRRIDLIDIATANTIVEMEELREALPLTPTGLEGLHLKSPQYANHEKETPGHRALQRFCRHRQSHQGRKNGGRPHHLVAAHARRKDQRDARHHPRQRTSRTDAELCRRHRERHRLVPERCRSRPHRNHHPPKPLQSRRHARRLPRPPRHSVWRQHRQSRGVSFHQKQRTLHQRMADR